MAIHSFHESFDFDRSRARVSGLASTAAIGGITAAPWCARIVAEVGVGGVLVEHRQRHLAVLGQRGDGLVAERRRRRSPRRRRRPRRARPSRRARSPRSPCSTTSRSAFGLPPTASTSRAAATCRRWPATVVGPVGPEQLVDVSGVDPEQDQGLVERQRPPEFLQDRAVERDQGEPVEPLDPEGVEGERPLGVERPQGRAEVGRAGLEADEAEQGQGVVQVARARPSSARPARPRPRARPGAGAGRSGTSPRSAAAPGSSRATSPIRTRRSASSACLRLKYSRQWSRTSAAAASVRLSRSRRKSSGCRS